MCAFSRVSQEAFSSNTACRFLILLSSFKKYEYKQYQDLFLVGMMVCRWHYGITVWTTTQWDMIIILLWLLSNEIKCGWYLRNNRNNMLTYVRYHLIYIYFIFSIISSHVTTSIRIDIQEIENCFYFLIILNVSRFEVLNYNNV